jgi:hypothetical protein
VNDAGTIHILAKTVTDRFVSRNTRLAYRSPEVLVRLVVGQGPLAELTDTTYLPWARQAERLLGNVQSAAVCKSLSLSGKPHLTPEVQHSSYTAGGTDDLSQQRAFDPW